jgi:hypothetical protein
MSGLVRDLTLVLPHFMNLGMLDEQQKIWAAYPAELRARLHVIVVDDCSPKGSRPSPKCVFVKGLASFRIFRLLKKERWNWLACRNLGAKFATTDWLLLTDIDHGIPAGTLAPLLTEPLDPWTAYRFMRVTATRPWPYEVETAQPYRGYSDPSQCWAEKKPPIPAGWPLSALTPWKPHNDTWLLTRAMFFYDDGRKFVCGYDERLSGFYGSSGEFRDRLLDVAGHQVRHEMIVRYPREIVSDASTDPRLYTRKGDPLNDAGISERKRIRAMTPGWRPLHGRIPYESVYTSEEVAA